MASKVDMSRSGREIGVPEAIGKQIPVRLSAPLSQLSSARVIFRKSLICSARP
jgi:hypothetical protein